MAEIVPGIDIPTPEELQAQVDQQRRERDAKVAQLGRGQGRPAMKVQDFFRRRKEDRKLDERKAQSQQELGLMQKVMQNVRARNPGADLATLRGQINQQFVGELMSVNPQRAMQIMEAGANTQIEREKQQASIRASDAAARASSALASGREFGNQQDREEAKTAGALFENFKTGEQEWVPAGDPARMMALRKDGFIIVDEDAVGEHRMRVREAKIRKSLEIAKMVSERNIKSETGKMNTSLQKDLQKAAVTRTQTASRVLSGMDAALGTIQMAGGVEDQAGLQNYVKTEFWQRFQGALFNDSQSNEAVAQRAAIRQEMMAMKKVLLEAGGKALTPTEIQLFTSMAGDIDNALQSPEEFSKRMSLAFRRMRAEKDVGMMFLEAANAGDMNKFTELMRNEVELLNVERANAAVEDRFQPERVSYDELSKMDVDALRKFVDTNDFTGRSDLTTDQLIELLGRLEGKR